jgi:hypothetical protein
LCYCSFLNAALKEASKEHHEDATYEDYTSDSEPEDARHLTQVMHGYLPPVDVELSIEFGGVTEGQSDCRTICIKVGRDSISSCLLCVRVQLTPSYDTSLRFLTARSCSGSRNIQTSTSVTCRCCPACCLCWLPQAAVLSESAATLVLDHKVRVVYVTDKLATMLGYPVASLLKMELGTLLPQPYCQMHGTWFKVNCHHASTAALLRQSARPRLVQSLCHVCCRT